MSEWAELRGRTEPATAAREAIRRADADLRAMRRIADEWNKLTDAGKRFMLSALSSGMKEAKGD